jgi:hypothetical protein
MRRTPRITAALFSASLAIAALAVPLATPAAADTPVERVWTLADSDDDGTYGLWYVDVPGTTRVRVDETPVADLSDLSSSSDGTRIVYVRFTETRQQVVVRDMSTRVVRVVADVPSSANSFLGDPALSPDGNTVAWTSYAFSATGLTTHVWNSVVARGPAMSILNGYTVLAFADSTTLLVQTVGGYNAYVPVVGGTPKPLTGLPRYAQQLSGVKGAGSPVVYSLDTTTDPEAGSTATVHAGGVGYDGNHGTWVGDAGVEVAGQDDSEEPALSIDENTVYWVQYDGFYGPGEVMSRPRNLSSPAVVVAPSAADEVDVAVTRHPSSDVTVPGATSALPAVLEGTSATVRWNPPNDDDLSGFVVYRKEDGQITKAAFVPWYLQSWTDTGLTLGGTYTYEVRAVDRANHYGPASSRTLTAIKAFPAEFSTPTSFDSTTTSFQVLYGGDGPVTSWYVDYLAPNAPNNWWQRWVDGASFPDLITFGAPAADHVNATTSTAGASYSFRTLARDAYGNATPWVNSRRAVVPFDQTKATFYGGSNGYSSDAYLGSYRKLWHSTDYARVTLTGNRLEVVGTSCPTCGLFDVFDSGHWIGTVDSYAPTTTARDVLFAKSFTTIGTHHFAIKARGTADRPDVILDGFAMRA